MDNIKKYQSKIDVLVEVGSRDGLDSIKIAKNVNSKQNIILKLTLILLKTLKQILKLMGVILNSIT